MDFTTPQIPDSGSTLNDSSSSNSKTVEEIEHQKMLGEDISKSFVRLRQYRRHMRQISSSLTSTDALKKYKVHTKCDFSDFQRTDKPGTLSLDIDYITGTVAIGCADANAVVYDRFSGTTASILKGHSKQVTSLKFMRDSQFLVTGSADSTVRVWRRLDNWSYECMQTLDHHTAEVQAVTIHPDHKYFISASLDCTWKLYDLSCSSITQVGSFGGCERFLTAAFHPDGHIIGTGTSRFVRFWDISQQDDIVKLNTHDGLVTSMAFSENGRFLATAAEDGVKLWDLRFLRTFATFPTDGYTHKGPVDFDRSGIYLASGGSLVSLYNVTSASECGIITTFSDSFDAKISCLKFGNDANYVAAGVLDSNSLLFFESEETRKKEFDYYRTQNLTSSALDQSDYVAASYYHSPC